MKRRHLLLSRYNLLAISVILTAIYMGFIRDVNYETTYKLASINKKRVDIKEIKMLIKKRHLF